MKRDSSESLFTTLIPSLIFFRLKNFNMLLPHEAKAKDGSDGDIQRAGQTGQTEMFIHLL